MQNKIFYFLLIFFCGILPLSAQTGWGTDWFGVPSYRWYAGASFGYANNKLVQDGAEEYAYWTTWKNGNGISASVPLRFCLFNFLAFQIEPSYIQKNYEIIRSPPNYSDSTEKVTNHFINLPVLARFSFALGETGFQIFVNGGGFLGYWIAGHRQGSEQTITVNAYTGSGQIYEFDEAYEFDTRSDNRFEYGILAGGGVQYDWSAFSVFIEMRYHRGLSDLQKSYYTHYFAPKKNDTWTIQLGIVFNAGLFEF